MRWGFSEASRIAYPQRANHFKRGCLMKQQTWFTRTLAGKLRATAVTTAIATAAMISAPPVTATGSVSAPSGVGAAGYPACTDWQHKEFSTPGFDTDVSVYLCVAELEGKHLAWGVAKWLDGSGRKKFDNFDVKVRLERYDADYDTHRCDFTSEINNTYEDSKLCGDAESTSTRNSGWTADGVVYYDIDSDGRGGFTWNLQGTSKIN
jgi:hypothetical protein